MDSESEIDNLQSIYYNRWRFSWQEQIFFEKQKIEGPITRIGPHGKRTMKLLLFYAAGSKM